MSRILFILSNISNQLYDNKLYNEIAILTHYHVYITSFFLIFNITSRMNFQNGEKFVIIIHFENVE